MLAYNEHFRINNAYMINANYDFRVPADFRINNAYMHCLGAFRVAFRVSVMVILAGELCSQHVSAYQSYKYWHCRRR